MALGGNGFGRGGQVIEVVARVTTLRIGQIADRERNSALWRATSILEQKPGLTMPAAGSSSISMAQLGHSALEMTLHYAHAALNTTY